MRLILLLVVPVVAIFGLVLVMLLVPLPAPFPAPASSGRNLVAAITAGVLGLVYLAGITVVTVGDYGRRGRALDSLLKPMGLQASGRPLLGRSFRGSIAGRHVRVSFDPGPSLKPSLLQVHITAALSSRAAIGCGRPLLDCRDCPEVSLTPPGGLQVFCHDEQWVGTVLTRPETWVVVEQLLLGDGTAERCELYLQPATLWYRRYAMGTPGPEIRDRIEALLRLAPLLELTPPAASPRRAGA